MNIAEALLLLERKEVLYHGTTGTAAKRILKTGLLPNPKQTNWRESLHGVYLTHRLPLAAQYAMGLADRSGGQPAIFQVSIESKTMATGQSYGGKGFNLSTWTPLEGESARDMAGRWVNSIHRANPISPQQQKKLLDFGEKWATAVIAQKTVVMDNFVRRFYDMKGVFARADKPTPKQSPPINRRALEPINFRGANKIEALVILPPQGSPENWIKTIYGGSKAKQLANIVGAQVSYGAEIIQGSLKDLK